MLSKYQKDTFQVKKMEHMVLHSAVCNATAILSINQTLVNHCCHLVDMLQEKTFCSGQLY